MLRKVTMVVRCSNGAGVMTSTEGRAAELAPTTAGLSDAPTGGGIASCVSLQ